MEYIIEVDFSTNYMLWLFYTLYDSHLKRILVAIKSHSVYRIYIYYNQLHKNKLTGKLS